MNVNVLGCGVMGQQIAGLLAAGGFDVHVYARSDLSASTLARKVKLVQRQLGLRDATPGNVSVVHAVADLPDTLTIESITEDVVAKQALHREFRATHAAAFFSNTSSYSPREIADDVQGLHFFNPISMRLVELQVRHAVPDPTLEALLHFLRDSGFAVVNVHDNRGYIGNYLLFTAISNLLRLIERFDYDCAQIEQVNAILFSGQDLIAVIDIVGVDTTLHIIENLREQDESIYLPKKLVEAKASNILGKKNGTSFRSLLR